MGANELRGEVELPLAGGRVRLMRPSFAGLVAAEAETGSLFRLVERTAAGEVRLAEMGALFWHCLADRGADELRAPFEASLLEAGTASLIQPFRRLLVAALGAE